jgi:hypothetical protein
MRVQVKLPKFASRDGASMYPIPLSYRLKKRELSIRTELDES